MTRRAVITGIGVTAPTGLGAAAHWETVLRGENRVDRITLFDPSGYPVTLAGEVPGFAPEDHLDGRLAVQTDRWSWLALAATTEALSDAALDPAELPAASVSATMASSSGGNLFGQRELQRLWSSPARAVGAYQSIAWFYAATVGQVTIRHGLKGHSGVLCSESAGGLDSLAQAARSIRRGSAVVLAGGTESPLSPYALACQLRSGRLSERTDPDRAYRPFDEDADGHVPGEGGAVLVVEELQHALDRGAPHIYGELTGWGATHDGELDRPGAGGSAHHYGRAMRRALESSGLQPDGVDLVFPDAVGVPAYDRTEAEALRAVFGDAPRTRVTSQKALTGRLYQGGSALDVATALQSMRYGIVPPVAGVERPAPGCELNFVTEARRGPLDTVMVNARGFDGFNSSLVLRKVTSTEGP
ncbi:beta-ketoacyl synthase N-terminal-like domain-containing protein [Kitasatospora viridis]|uniref:Minimal PKS chain-length factor (CLF/KS beta) n=1 Tax=Kitasatospora viridis TaxID=281105 RepID=A0A561UCH0_9ACTN|nr:beta-ketoacyl synthase N-terminal-like domain-containing protein [Kitasatospora viridis]TWF97062.1 minimal PKS chain-length factor (CLF/KS beta) [Kitasatospora viridis]